LQPNARFDVIEVKPSDEKSDAFEFQTASNIKKNDAESLTSPASPIK